MPGFVTHYIFGRETYRKLSSSSLKKNIYNNHSAYSLGQQGPDLFFYYLPSYVLEGHNLGSIAHVQESNAFFRGLLRSCLSITNRFDRAVAEAYVAGFIGHYTLDTICHPYVYAMTHYNGREKDYFARHAYLETDIDTALLDMKLNRQPCNFYSADTITLTRRQKKVIAKLLYHAYHYAYPELRIRKYTMYLGIFSLPLGLRILHDDTGKRKVLFRLIEKYVLGYPVFSPLVPSDTLFFRTDPFNLRRAKWTNPWDKSLTSSETFFDLYEKAFGTYLRRIEIFSALLSSLSDPEQHEQLTRTLLKDYGNRSFHSGLDCSIPS